MKLLITLATLILCSCQSAANPPVEIGTVKYRESLKTALTESKKTGKPIFLLFQEIPG